jgi:hypothetical protein
MASQNRCKKGYRRCNITKTCITKSKSRLSTSKRCRNGSRKCANKRCYGKSKKTRYLFNIH